VKRSTSRLLAEQSLVIARSATDIFAVAGDPGQYASWSPGVVGVEPAGQPPTPGATYRETIDVPLVGPQTVPLTVVDVIEARLLTVDAAIPLLKPRFVLALRAIDDHTTEVIWRAETRNLSPLTHVVGPPLRAWLSHQGAASLRALQARLEPEPIAVPVGPHPLRRLVPLVVAAGALLFFWRRRQD
jgi:hypothetical protein